MEQEQFDQLEDILHTFADNLQTQGGFCIQFNDDNQNAFCAAAHEIALSIESVASSINNLAAAVKFHKR